MFLSSNSAAVLVDLVENKLAVMSVDGRDDLREMMALQRCLAELKGIDALQSDMARTGHSEPLSRRGRRPRITTIEAFTHADPVARKTDKSEQQ